MQIFVIKMLRTSKNITLYKLSKDTNLSRTYLRNLENNKTFNPTLCTLEKIANALDVNIKQLFYSLDEIETLRAEIHSRIDKYGINSKEVMEISQLIDLLINVKFKS